MSNKRQMFIEATLECLAEYGYKGTTVRKITETLGVTAGLLKHYFSGKDELIVEAYRYANEASLRLGREEVSKAGHDPEERIVAFIRTLFKDDLVMNVKIKAWVSFWGLIPVSPGLSKAHAETYALYRENLESLISDVYASKGKHIDPMEIKGIAISFISLGDGLWLETNLNPENLPLKTAEGLMLDFVYRRLGLLDE